MITLRRTIGLPLLTLAGLAPLLLASVVLSGCGPRPRIGTLNEASVILAFGDSLTAGTGAAKSESYPAELECVARILSAPALTSDPAHPNAAGYRRLAEVVFALVERSSSGAH